MVLFYPRPYLTLGQLPPVARKTSDDFQFEPMVMSRRIVIVPRCIREDSKSQLRRSTAPIAPTEAIHRMIAQFPARRQGTRDPHPPAR